VRNLSARRRHGMLLITAILVGVLVAASPALARGKAPRGPKPQSGPTTPGPKPLAPPDWIASILANVDVSGPSCSTPPLSQPFSAWGDSAYYTLAPGQSPGAFTGGGWLLFDGAHVTSAVQADGRTGQVLDLPSGSLAVSPPMCVDSTYPTARTMIRNVSGGGGVAVFVTYAGASIWGKARNGGNAHGQGQNWGLSDRINLQPSSAPGWQLLRFALAPSNGRDDEFQLYNLYVDPYAKG
jgi:hypothetical protein